jgi:hypothetical protein
MVDLAFGRAVALLAVALLAGCAAKPAAPAFITTGSALRSEMARALDSGDHATLTRDAVALASIGGALSDATFDKIAPSLDPAILHASQKAQDAAALRRRYHDNANPVLRSDTDGPGIFGHPVPVIYRLVEGIAYDPGSKRLFVGTVVDGRLAYFENGHWTEVPVGLPKAGLFGMAVDPVRRLLWIAVATVEPTAVPAPRMAGLIAVSLDTLAVTRRVALTDDAHATPGDLALAPDGSVYVSDSSTGAIYRCLPGCTALRVFLPAGTFHSPQGMVVAKNGGRLIVADYASGLWFADTTSGVYQLFKTDRDMMLDGIDGLVAMPGEHALMATQNGTNPHRILKLHLDESGTRVTDAEVRHIVSGEPSLGTLVNGDLWYVTDGHWDAYGPGGALVDGATAKATEIGIAGTGKRVR